ncbi:MAG: precorrin-6A/cobalt-precorrin-6A reductase, partial [Actinomycetota bacterium]
VTKDSGREGGLEEKLKAAELEGAAVILVRRPGEPDAIHDLDVLLGRLNASLAHERSMDASAGITDSAGRGEAAGDRAVTEA